MSFNRFLLVLFFVFLFVEISSADRYYYALRFWGSSLYTDNLYLTEDNKEDDVNSNLGLSFSADKATRVSDLLFNYSLSRSFYWQNSDDSAFRHNLSLSYFRDLSKRLSVSLSSNYYRTEESIEPNEQVFRERRRSREPYYRFNGDLSLDYEYAKDSFFSAGLRLNYLQNEDPNIEDSRIYTEYFSLSKDFTWWFLKGELSFTQREFETERPVNTWGANISLGYKLAHNKHISFGASAERTQNIGPNEDDYWAYNFNISYAWQVTKTQAYHFSVGYYFRDSDMRGKENEGITFSVDYSKKFKLTTFSVRGSGGYRYEYAEAQNTGFTEYYNISFSLSRDLTRSLALTSSCFYRIEDFKQRESGQEKTYGLSLGLQKQLTKRLSLSASYSYRKADSDLPGNDYDVNSIFLSINYLFWQAKEFPLKIFSL